MLLQLTLTEAISIQILGFKCRVCSKKEKKCFAKFFHFFRSRKMLKFLFFLQNFASICFAKKCEIRNAKIQRTNAKFHHKRQNTAIQHIFRFVFAFFASFISRKNAKFHKEVCEIGMKIFAFFLETFCSLQTLV